MQKPLYQCSHLWLMPRHGHHPDVHQGDPEPDTHCGECAPAAEGDQMATGGTGSAQSCKHLLLPQQRV